MEPPAAAPGPGDCHQGFEILQARSAVAWPALSIGFLHRGLAGRDAAQHWRLKQTYVPGFLDGSARSALRVPCALYAFLQRPGYRAPEPDHAPAVPGRSEAHSVGQEPGRILHRCCGRDTDHLAGSLFNGCVEFYPACIGDRTGRYRRDSGYWQLYLGLLSDAYAPDPARFPIIWGERVNAERLSARCYVDGNARHHDSSADTGRVGAGAARHSERALDLVCQHSRLSHLWCCDLLWRNGVRCATHR